MKKTWIILLIVLNFNILELWSDDMVRTRSQVPQQERWNVEALFANAMDWKKEFEVVKGEKTAPHWPDLSAFAGKLKASPQAVLQFFDLYFDLDRKLSKLYTYAHLRHDEDIVNDENLQNYGLVSSLLHDFSLEFSWVEPELLSMKGEDFQSLIADPRIQKYRFHLEKLGRMRPHVLSAELEGVVALSGKALETPSKAFGALNNADMTFLPAVTSQGEIKELTTGTYLQYIRDPDRALRKSAFINLHRAYEAYANTICELIQGQVQSHLFVARARKFKDCRESALFGNCIDPAVYDNLIEVIHENLGALHEYMHLRKELLGLDELHPYDLHVPLVEEVQTQMKYMDACRQVIDSVSLLGMAYRNDLEKGLEKSRWVDPFENKNKRSGAYSSGCYDSMPYILMNYHGTLNDVLTLAHEAGHSMHSFLSRKHQSYVNSQYPIFVAEVASTFNEQLLLQSLKEKAISKKELAYLVNYEIEAIRTTIFRQTLFAEFEWKIHSMAEKGQTLTPALLNEAYLALNRTYYGPEIILDGGLEVEWARIPHFYYNFYVYQYATGLSAALALFERTACRNPTPSGVGLGKLFDGAVSGDSRTASKSRDRYLQFLSSGGSRYPLDLLQIAGVDLRKKEPIELAMKRFRGLVKELKTLLGE
ncbi:MAG: Oligoendopeptidase [Parachlamydiales bacterium]|nr:Oligoendopeptidase [Parachlamydiales bacterium]